MPDPGKSALQSLCLNVVQNDISDAGIGLVSGRVGFEDAISIEGGHIANLNIARRAIDPENAIAKIMDRNMRITLPIAHAIEVFAKAVDAHFIPR